MSAAGGSFAARLALALRNERLRLLVAATLLGVGVVMLGTLLVHQAQAPNGQYGIDFGDYRAASLRVLDRHSPYAPEMLEGPIPAQGVDRYRYPPPFALLVAPIAVLPQTASATAWLAVQVAAILAALLLAVRSTGRRIGLRHVLWCGAAGCYFFPVFDTLWKGNVDGALAFLAALAFAGSRGARSGDALWGAASAAAAWLKVSPLTLLVAVATNRRAIVGAAAVSAIVILPSAIVAPQAWPDYARVLPNLLAGTADYASNLAPGQLLAATPGIPDWLAGAARWASVAAAALLALAALGGELLRRDRRLVVLAGVAASLLLPAALWYHYLVVLLPFGVAAWLESSSRTVRGALLVGAAGVDLGLGLGLGLATLGAALFVLGSAGGLWQAVGARPDPAPGAGAAPPPTI
jgi:hypothetical protein